MRGTIIEERMDETKTRPRLLLDWMVKEGCSMLNEKLRNVMNGDTGTWR